MTQKEYKFAVRYLDANRKNQRSLTQFYKKVNANKIAAFEDCREKQRKDNGFCGAITFANCHFFGYGYLYYNSNGNLMLKYLTGKNEYDICME